MEKNDGGQIFDVEFSFFANVLENVVDVRAIQRVGTGGDPIAVLSEACIQFKYTNIK